MRTKAILYVLTALITTVAVALLLVTQQSTEPRTPKPMNLTTQDNKTILISKVKIHEERTKERRQVEEIAKKRPIACYYLMNIDLKKLKGRTFEVMIIEFEEGLGESGVEYLKHHCRLLLAYINFGYAEDWRDYWSKIRNATWIHEPTEYEGEYFIEYWRPEWHNIVIEKAVRAHELGFDGVLLDNVDACVVLKGRNQSWIQGLNLTQLMIDSIHSISSRLRKLCGRSFKIFVNIGSAVKLLGNEKFLNAIDGVLREEVWYTVSNNRTVTVPPGETEYVLKYLIHARNRGKVVIVADFVDSIERAREFMDRCWRLGFIPIPQPVWANDYSEPPPREWCDLDPS